MLTKVTLAILLWMIWLFSGCSLAVAGDADAVYMNTTNTDIKIHHGDKLDVPTFILVPSLLHKDVEIYVWMDNVKGKNNTPLQSKYFSDKYSWELLAFNQFQPLVKFSSFSPYYNRVLSYGTISGIKSFTLNVCVKENVKTVLSINIAPSVSIIKASSVCGLRLITIN